MMVELTLSGIALAQGTEKHSKMIPADAQKKKLHVLKPMVSVATEFTAATSSIMRDVRTFYFCSDRYKETFIKGIN